MWPTHFDSTLVKTNKQTKKKQDKIKTLVI